MIAGLRDAALILGCLAVEAAGALAAAFESQCREQVQR